MDSHDLQVLENVLEDTPADAHTRRRLIQVAAAGSALALERGDSGAGPAQGGVAEADPQQPGHRRELRRDLPDRGDPARAGHAVGGPGRDAEGRQHGRVRPRGRAARARRAPVHAALLDPGRGVRRRRRGPLRVDRDGRHGGADGLPDRHHRVRQARRRARRALPGRGLRGRVRAPRDRALRPDRARRPPADLDRPQLRAMVDQDGRRDDPGARGRRASGSTSAARSRAPSTTSRATRWPAASDSGNAGRKPV